jgi:hypothetical protein
MRQPLIDSFADLVEAPQAQLLIEL